jgi:hypothetical protein
MGHAVNWIRAAVDRLVEDTLAVAGNAVGSPSVKDSGYLDGLLRRIGVKTASAACRVYCHSVACPYAHCPSNAKDLLRCHNYCTGYLYYYCYPGCVRGCLHLGAC